MLSHVMPSIRLRPEDLRKCGAVALVLLCAACQVPLSQPLSAPAADAAPFAPPEDAERYAVDPAASEVRILVSRDGPLAALGHSHVILAGGLEGALYLAPEDIPGSAFELRIAPEAFIVDPPGARAEEGEEFAGARPAEAIEGTRTNMLGPHVLDAARYPEITLRSVALSGSREAPRAAVRIFLRGVARDIAVPLEARYATEAITVSGAFSLRQTEFGITPFTAMGGGLAVKDEIRIRFRLVFRKEHQIGVSAANPDVRQGWRSSLHSLCPANEFNATRLAARPGAPAAP